MIDKKELMFLLAGLALILLGAACIKIGRRIPKQDKKDKD